MNDDIKRLVEALKPFAAFADPHKRVPPNLTITQGSSLAKRQLTMAACYAAADALAAFTSTKGTQE